MSHLSSRRIALALLVFILPAAGLLARPQSEKAAPAKISVAAIEVKKVECDEVKLPPEFQMAFYEDLFAALEKTGKFQQVFRDGDKLAKAVPELAAVRTSVRGFKEGSQRMRQVTTVAGTTSIKVHLDIVTRDGKHLLEQDTEGKVHFFGENLRATYNLAKEVAKIVNQKFQPAPAAVKAASK